MKRLIIAILLLAALAALPLQASACTAVYVGSESPGTVLTDSFWQKMARMPRGKRRQSGTGRP